MIKLYGEHNYEEKIKKNMSRPISVKLDIKTAIFISEMTYNIVLHNITIIATHNAASSISLKKLICVIQGDVSKALQYVNKIVWDK